MIFVVYNTRIRINEAENVKITVTTYIWNNKTDYLYWGR